MKTNCQIQKFKAEHKRMDNLALKKNQRHSGWWGFPRRTNALLDLQNVQIDQAYRFTAYSFDCFIPLPILQCISQVRYRLFKTRNRKNKVSSILSNFPQNKFFRIVQF